MLPLQRLKNNRWNLLALITALLVNASLTGLIYGLTIGDKELSAVLPITLSFSQFSDSSVVEKSLESITAVLPEPVLNERVLSPTPPAVAILNVPNIYSVSSLSLPSIVVPKFNIMPEFVNVTSDIMVEKVKIVESPTLRAVKLQAIAPVQSYADIKADNNIENVGSLTAKIGLAKVLRKTNPQYPYKAKRLGVEGYVVLNILIDDTGKVKEVKVIEEKPRGYFAKVSRREVRRWDFEKAPKGMTVWKKQRMIFELY